MTDLDYDAIRKKVLTELGATPQLTVGAPVWDSRFGTVPTLANDGVATQGAIRAKVGVRLRQTPGRLRAVLRVDTAQAADTIGIRIGGAAQATTTGHDAAADAVAALKTALDGAASFADTLNGTATIGGTNNTSLLVEVDGEPDVELGSGVQGAPRVSAVAEARWCLWRVWGRLRGVNVWAPLPGLAPQRTDDVVALVDIDCAGYDQLAVEVIASDGVVLPLVAPGISDEQSAEAASASAKSLGEAEAAFASAFSLGSAAVTVEGHLATADQLAAGQLASLGTGGEGLVCVRQERVTVTDAGATLMSFSPRRREFVCLNLSSDDPYYRAWILDGKTTATTSDCRVAPDGVDQGGSVCHGVHAIADTGKTVNVWVEEYE